MTDPTPRGALIPVSVAQHRMLVAIGNCTMSPTIRELGDAVGIRSTNAVQDCLRILQRKGLVARDPVLSRTIRLTDAGKERLGLANRGFTAPVKIVQVRPVIHCSCGVSRVGEGTCCDCGAPVVFTLDSLRRTA